MGFYRTNRCWGVPSHHRQTKSHGLCLEADYLIEIHLILLKNKINFIYLKCSRQIVFSLRILTCQRSLKTTHNNSRLQRREPASEVYSKMWIIGLSSTMEVRIWCLIFNEALIPLAATLTRHRACDQIDSLNWARRQINSINPSKTYLRKLNRKPQKKSYLKELKLGLGLIGLNY